MRFAASRVDGGQQLVLFHDIEPRNRAERCADGDDVDRNEIHPRAPFRNRLHEKAGSEAKNADDGKHRRAVQLRELMKQGLRDGLKHVLEGTDTGKNHRKIEDNREEPYPGII